MNELIHVSEDGKITARELYEFLELNPANFSHWARRNIVENQFAEEDKDYLRLVVQDETPTGGKVDRVDYSLTIDLAKKLCMVSNSPKGESARNYFIEVEKRLKAVTAPTSIEDLIILQATSMKELRQRQDEQGAAIKQLAAKMETIPEQYYSIAGFASLRGAKADLSKAGLLGRKATKLSQEYGIDVGKAYDPRFGTVNTYHVDVLNEVFV